MIEKELIINFATQFLEGTPDYLTDVTVSADNTIVIEIDNDHGVDIDDCVALSKHIESKLDRETEDFELTVTSAGLSSPFKILRQYKKYEGKEVEVLCKNGQKVTGTLKSSDQNGFVVIASKKVKPEGAKRKIEVETEIPFAFDEIKHTKYLIRFK